MSIVNHETGVLTAIRKAQEISALGGGLDDTHVYFVQRGGIDGPVKIGASSNVVRRLAELQIGSPEPLRIIGVWLLAGRKAESGLHRMHAADRGRNPKHRQRRRPGKRTASRAELLHEGYDMSTLTSERIVTTQAELDAALADKVRWIEIRSPKGIRLKVSASGSSTVRAYDSSTVTASGSSTVRAYDSSTVRAYDSSTVTAYGYSTVTASDSSTVRAYDSSTVTAYDSSTVTAYDSSTVTAYGYSTVTASDSSTVRAYDSSTVTASRGVAVHLHSGYVKLSGNGVVLDHTEKLTDPADWCDYHGVEVDAEGIATLYKATRDDYLSSWGMSYEPGSTPSAPDWRDNDQCGYGLHFSPSPGQALAYDESATRFLRVGVAVDTLRPLDGGAAKCKAPAVVRACVEVDIAGREVSA